MCCCSWNNNLDCLNTFELIIFTLSYLCQFANGWVHGEQLCENNKVHPLLKPYRALAEKVKTFFFNKCGCKCEDTSVTKAKSGQIPEAPSYQMWCIRRIKDEKASVCGLWIITPLPPPDKSVFCVSVCACVDNILLLSRLEYQNISGMFCLSAALWWLKFYSPVTVHVYIRPVNGISAKRLFFRHLWDVFKVDF